jgi:hypothetical protein
MRACKAAEHKPKRTLTTWQRMRNQVIAGASAGLVEVSVLDMSSIYV